MKLLIAALLATSFAIGAARAQAPVTPVGPAATPVHKKAAPAPRHKKASVKKDRIKKVALF